MCKEIGCPVCKKKFTINTSKGRPPTYCSKNCREQGYKEKQEKAKQNYRNKNKNTAHEEKCRCCGNTFITRGNIKYCSKRCRTTNQREQNHLAVVRYQRKTRNEKMDYFAYLGNSNIRPDTPRKASWVEELKLIRAEKRRLGL